MLRPLLALAALCLSVAAPAATRADFEALLATDRAFAAAGRDALLPDALAAMFAEDVVLIADGRPDHVRGRAAARAALAAKGTGIRAEWAPVGGGISSDGRHGYSYGGITVRAPDRPDQRLKYLSYWVKGADGWRVAAYVRRPAPLAGPLDAAPPVIGTARHRDAAATSLGAAEQAFSDRARHVGLRAAFTEYGRAESINIGAAAGIAVGAEAIGRGVAGSERTSALEWSADEVLVAPSGDMGVSIGRIRFTGAPPPGAPASIPFFTVWARPAEGDPWRYVAE